METEKKTVKYIDDLSWSNIVNLIQHDEKKGAEILNVCAFELKEVLQQIEECEEKLKRIESRKKTLLQAGLNVAQCLKKNIPLIVQEPGYVIILSDNNILIERNVI